MKKYDVQPLTNIHATCVKIGRYGVLFLGDSGSGKSDMALRLISGKGAKLVADDRVDISILNEKLIASAPKQISGLLEVRGIGIVQMPCVHSAHVVMAVNLVSDSSKIERMPANCEICFGDIKIPSVDLCAFEASAADKVVIKLKAILDKTKKQS